MNNSVTIITFLGTGRYTKCCYVKDDWSSGPVTYVQTAVCKFWRDQEERPVSLKVFCTALATETHWKKLNDELVKERFGGQIEKIDIKDPFTEEGVWNIFNSLREQDLPENADIVFDITHSFRSLPMIMSLFLNYLKVTKQAHLVGCHYGAFEKLLEGKTRADGQRYTVQDLEREVPDVGERKAPLVSLEKMFELNDWAQAVHDFKDLGNGRPLATLSIKLCNDVARSASTEHLCKGGTPIQRWAGEVKKLAKAVCGFSKNVRENRLGGKKGIMQTDFGEKLAVPEIADKQDGYMNALVPLLKSLSGTLTGTDHGDLGLHKPKDGMDGALNGLRAAWWAYKHDMLPQALTLAEEAIISFFVEKYRGRIAPLINDGNGESKIRDFMECIINRYAVKRKEDTNADKIFFEKLEKDIFKRKREQLGEVIKAGQEIGTEIESLKDCYSDIKQNRNDINHAGTKGKAKSEFPLEDIWENLFKMDDFKALKALQGDMPQETPGGAPGASKGFQSP